MSAANSTMASARRLLWRDWRGGELGILIVAVVLAVAVVVGISVFVARLQSSLEAESTRFLAADMVVRSSREPPSNWFETADRHNLRRAQTLSFASMTFSDGDEMTRSNIKAVTPGYPLRGELLYSVAPFDPAGPTAAVPERGEAWINQRLFSMLDVALGDTVYVGDLGLTISGTLRGEPDAVTSVFGVDPTLMMNFDDIPATNVVQPGSRVAYRLLLRGEQPALDAFRAEVEPDLVQGQRLIDVEDTQPSIGQTLDRARGFLLLAGSLGVVLAAAAVALAARRFSERHTDYVAVMKSMGASSGTIARLYGTSLTLLGLVATVLGCAAGWGIQAVFFALIEDQMFVAPGGSGVTPYLIGTATALVCLLLFAWPPLRRLGLVPPLRVLRRDIDAGAAQRPVDYLLGGCAIAGLMWWYSGDIRMTGGLLAGLLVTVGLGFVAARTLLMGGRSIGAQAGSVWRLALAGLQRRGAANALQMTIFAIAIMLLLVLTIVRTSLIGQWAAQLPPGTPNHFLLNITDAQRAPLASFIREQGLEEQRLFAMTRGRIMAVNGEALAGNDGRNDDEQQVREGGRQREANFTSSATLFSKNKIIAGEWWDPDTSDMLVSLEQGFAEDVGAQVGDRLSIRIAADTFDVRLANIREVDWQSLQPNFFVIFPPGVLDQFPRTYMTSFYLPPDRKPTLNSMVREFPTVSVIEIDVVISEIQSIVARVGSAIELVLGVILLSGSLVLIAGVQASVDVRLRESALLRALGASSGRLLGALWIEFTMLGAMAGLLAVLGAEAAAWGLQTQALDLRYEPSMQLWPLGIAAGGLVVGVLGVASCRKAVNVPPLAVLREL